jgi:thioredoxin reductase (NADPH)
MQKRAFEQPKIEMVWDSVVDDIVGLEAVTAIEAEECQNRGYLGLPINGVFVAIGSYPNSKNFKGSVAMDESGFIG